MKTDWKCIVVIAIALVLGASLLVSLAAARCGGGRGGEMGERGFAGEGDRGFVQGAGVGGFDDRGVTWHDNDWDWWNGNWNSWGGGFPWYGNNYPAAYPVFVPANYGGNQGACYQACVNSGQYSHAQCGQMCYNVP
jgi:hypothetical protein